MSSARARRRDRRVYLAGHPMLFLLTAAVRRPPVRRLGSRVVVNGTAELRSVLTDVPLDRTSELTTGGAIRKHEGSGALFDQTGAEHRASRRGLASRLDSRGVAALRPAWTPALDRLTDELAGGAAPDLAAFADELSGRTTAALLGVDMTDRHDFGDLARAARRTAASAAAAELPSLRPPRFVDHLDEVFGPAPDPLAKMLALAAVTTTYASIPRAVAWTADAGLWSAAENPTRREALTRELLRVTAPTPLLPRVPAEDAIVGGVRLRAGHQVLLLVRHAVGAHRQDPDPDAPAPPEVSQLVFGAGQHACPGAQLARAQLGDVLAALAPFAPRVTRARADRAAALPAWRELRVSATRGGR